MDCVFLDGQIFDITQTQPKSVANKIQQLVFYRLQERRVTTAAWQVCRLLCIFVGL